MQFLILLERIQIFWLVEHIFQRIRKIIHENGQNRPKNRLISYPSSPEPKSGQNNPSRIDLFSLLWFLRHQFWKFVLLCKTGFFATFKLRYLHNGSSFFDSVKSGNFLDQALSYGFNINNWPKPPPCHLNPFKVCLGVRVIGKLGNKTIYLTFDR